MFRRCLGEEIKWGKMPENGKYSIAGISMFDVNQGYLGNCWLLASMAAAAAPQADQVFNHCINLDKNEKANPDQGYCFNFYKLNKWHPVRVSRI